MASSARGRYDPVFQPSSGPSYVDPAPKTPAITNPFEIESQYPNTPGIQRFEYDPKQAISRQTSPFLRHSRWYGVFMVIGDAFLSLLPVLFIILAFRALAVNGHPLSSSGQVVVQAAKLGPTAFPIIFAAVVGRLMRTYALWKAERGTRLGVLEQLVGSQNLLASIERVFVLRNYTLLGLSILILWALSPVGGQSALRVIGTTESPSSGSQRVYYFNTTNDQFHGTAFDGADDIYTNGPSMEAVYRAALLAPENVKASSVDIWNNPKVPFLEQVPSYDESSNPWLEVPDVTNTSYSSLTGIIVSNLPSGHTSNFSIETSYFHLDCTDPQFFNKDTSANYSANPDQFYGGFLDWLGNIYFTENKTKYVFGLNQSSTGDFEFSSFMVDTNWNYEGNPLQSPINLIYASQGAYAPEVAAFNCTVGTTRVEANLLCSGSTGRDCRVGRMRRSLIDLTPNTTTPFNSGDPVYMINFISWFTFAAGAMHSGVISPTDLYLTGSNNPYEPFGTGSFGESSSPYHGVSGHNFAIRFARLLNTAWQVSLATASIAQPPSDNLTALAENALGYNTANVTANTLLFTEVYAADPVWVALTLVISFILLACGIAGMAFKYLTKAPDILGYVSTMTRDNPYFHARTAEVRAEGEDAAGSGAGSGWDEATDGSNRGSGNLLLSQWRTTRQAAGRKETRNGDLLDGLERARLLRNARVQIADVKPWTESGHVALRSVGT